MGEENKTKGQNEQWSETKTAWKIYSVAKKASKIKKELQLRLEL